jgi:hypothetical protein
VEVVEGRFDVPPVKARQAARLLDVGERVAMERAMRRVPQLDLGEPFVIRHATVPEQLDLRLIGNRHQVLHQHALLHDVRSIAVTISRHCGIETAREIELVAWRKCLLIANDDDLVR